MAIIGFASKVDRRNAFQFGTDPAANDRVVIDQNNTNRLHGAYSDNAWSRHLRGNHASMRVPSPGVDSSSNRPPARVARSSMLNKPRLAPRWADRKSVV